MVFITVTDSICVRINIWKDYPYSVQKNILVMNGI